MLQIQELTITHQKDFRVILKDFNLVLKKGDKAAIIGEEGNGKSTLLKWIYDPEMTEEYARCQGKRILGKERIGYLPQELSKQDGEKTLYEFFSELPAFWNKTPKELSAYAKKCQLSIDFFYSDQQMKSLSGGERIKAQLLGLLIEEPELLLLDEPSNDIDLATLKLLEKVILEWNGIVIFISHDEMLIEAVANMIIHLEQIRRKTESRYTVARMKYSRYVEERRSRFEKQEQQAINDRREKRLRDEKYRRVLQSVDRAQVTIRGAGKDLVDKMQAGRNLKDKMHTVKAMGRRFEKEDEKMTEMPEQEEAIFFKLGNSESQIPAGKTVLSYELSRLTAPGEANRLLAENIVLHIRGSQRICIVGANGVGKTTLLRRIAEELLARKDLRVQYMPQNYEDLLELDLTPVEYLDSTGDKTRRTRIRTYLGALKYTTDEMEHPIRELSGGQKAKVLLLKMSLSDANVLILDEPTRNFSPLSGPVIRKMIREFPGAVISISHDRKYIDEVCDEVYELTPTGLKKWEERKS